MRIALVGFVLLLAVTLLAFSLLAVFPAPTYRLWQLAILATERGHLFALVGLPFILGWRYSRATRMAAALALVGAFLLITPLLRSFALLQALPAGDSTDGVASFAYRLLGGGERAVVARRIAFAKHEEARLDLDFYRPPSLRGIPPIVIVIHGGSWRGGDQTQLPMLNRRLAHRGYAVAAITYRVAPRHTFPAQLEDVRTAISFVKRHASELNIDSSRIVLLGRSAGGQLALLAAYTANDPAIKGVVSLYAPTDLIWGYEHPSARLVHDSKGVLRDFIGGTPATHADAYRRSSPITFAASAPPTLLIHGARDELVFVEHSRRLARALKQAARRYTYIELPWATHGCDFVFNGPCGQISTRAVEQFLEAAFASR